MGNTAADSQNAGINVSADERIASVVGGAVLILPALVQPSRGRMLLAIGGAALLQRGCTGRCALYRALGINTASRPESLPRHRDRDPVEQASEDSFPASDSPSWTPVKGSVAAGR